MTLNFPNECRSFDRKRNLIRFWGYDSALEVSFFVEVGALYKLYPQMKDMEEGYLEAFDAVRNLIYETARKAYSRHGKTAYLLVAADF